MSRRPSDQIANSRDAEGRQVIWEAIRTRGKELFSILALTDATWISRHTIRSYVNCLTAGGVLERVETPEGLRWRLVRDEGYYAPRLNQKGEPVTQGLGVEQMWRAMRGLKQFNPRDLAIHATTDVVGVSNETAKSYCSMLLSCGYLACTQKATNTHQATYQLIRNSGPLAPQIQRVKQVFDPNSKTVYQKGDA